jgi:hypothetical protein
MPMIRGAPGLDVAALVKGVLSSQENLQPSALAGNLSDSIRRRRGSVPGAANAYDRLFGTAVGRQAASLIGNESRTLDAISSLSLEVVFEYLRDTMPSLTTGRGEARVLAVPGMPDERPSLLILDPGLPDVSQSERLTDRVRFDPQGLGAAFDRLRPYMAGGIDDRLVAAIDTADVHAAVELLFVSLPEVVVTSRPRMERLCAPAPHVVVKSGPELSSVGIYCRDATGRLGVTACLHGTGPVETSVAVSGAPSAVALADPVQDIVFIPLPESQLPPMRGRGGVRRDLAPSEAEQVSFDGAGSRQRVTTYVKSHDAGILRHRRTLQLKVQTPADTNRGDSGCSLIDGWDRVVAFAFERTGFNEYPEYSDWIWADNALLALELTPA